MNQFDQIAKKIFKITGDEAVPDSLSSKDIPEWDSMNYLLFIAELEKQFDVSLSMDEVMNANCVGDIRKAIENRIKK